MRGAPPPAPPGDFCLGKSHQNRSAPKGSPASPVPRVCVGLRRCAYGASLRRMRTCVIHHAPLRARLRPVLDARSPTGRKRKATVVLRLGPVWRAQAAQAFGREPERARQDDARGPPGQGRAVGPPPRQRRVRAGGVAPFRVRLSFGNFSLAKQRKVTCRGSATHK